MKWIICSLALLGAVTIQAQNVSVSPYSSMGLGEQLYNNNTEIGGMGGISTVPTNPYGQSANFSNPAANQNIRMTSFNVSARADQNTFESSSDKVTAGTFKLSNISLAFPVSKSSTFGMGFQPYSSVGYDISNSTSKNNINTTSNMKGTGGVNSVHAFYNQNLGEGFSVGLRANYLFGKIEKNEKITVEGASLLTDYTTKSNLRGLQFTLGSMYHTKVSKTNNIYVGAYYTLGSNLRTDFTDMTSTYTYMGSTPSSVDTVSYNRNDGLKTKLPHTLALGAAYTKDNNWSISGEARLNTWSNFEKPSFGNNSSVDNNTNYKNNYYLAVGGYWIPDFNSYKSYFNRVIYRAGAYYETAAYSIYGTDINRYGVTVGAGLPIGKANDASLLNLSLEYGQKGSSSKGLIKENYLGFKIGFDINDIWFRKRVID